MTAGPASPLSVQETSKTLPTCTNPTGGEVTILINGGSEKYDVTYNGVTQSATGGVPIAVTGVTAGPYSIAIIDVNCSELATYYLTGDMSLQDVPALVMNPVVTVYPTCTDPNSGEVSITIEGGSGYYKLSLPDGTYTSITSAIYTIRCFSCCYRKLYYFRTG